MHSVEKATLDDLNAVRALNSLLRIPVDTFYWDGIPYIESAIREGRCFVVRRRGTAAGCMIVERRPPDGLHAREYLAIGTLSVQPPFRKGSVGIRLVEFAKRLAREEKKRLYVESFCEFRKATYYCALGFTQVAPRTYMGKPYQVFYLDPEAA